MKILFIWHAAVEPEYRRIFAPMVAAGHEVVLVTADSWYESARQQVFEPKLDDACEVVALPTRFTNHVRRFWYRGAGKIRSLLRNFVPDIVYLNEEPFSFAAYQWVRMVQKTCPSTPVILETNENLVIKHPFPFSYTQKKVLEFVKGLAIVPNAGFGIYEGLGYAGVMAKTANFVDLEKYRMLKRDEVLRELSVPDLPADALVIGYAGRIAPEKGIDLVVEALSILGETAKHIHVCIAGSGRAEYVGEIKTLIESRMLTNRFHFLGSLKQTELNAMYNLAECMVLPSRTTSWWIEQFGRVIVEAMACGTPVIGSSSGEIPFVVDNPVLIFPEEDTAKLAELLGSFASGVFTKSSFSGYAKKRASDFSIENVAKGKLSAMERVLDHNTLSQGIR